MPSRRIDLSADAAEEYMALDQSVRAEVIKAIEKLRVDPTAYGKPLGARAGLNLFGLWSIEAAGRRLRVIYAVSMPDGDVLVHVIGRRDKFAAHRTAQERIRAFTEATEMELRAWDEIRTASGQP